jgi:Mrp family chromosome partitioning ATPase
VGRLAPTGISEALRPAFRSSLRDWRLGGRLPILRQFDPKLALEAARKWSLASLFRRSPPANASTSFRFLARRIGNDLPADDGRTIVLSSLVDGPSSGETASMLAWYLRDELACDVLVIDGGFRDGALSAHFGLQDSPGLLNSIRSGSKFQDHAKRIAEGISLLPVGTGSSETQNFDSALVARLLKAAQEKWPYVVVLHGPVGSDTRFVAFGAMADLVLLLAEEGGTRLAEVEAANELYHQNGIAGVQLLMTSGGSGPGDAPEEG